MRARYQGNRNHFARNARVVRQGEYTLNLVRTGFFMRLFGFPLVACVWSHGENHWMPYRSMEAFEKDWRVK